jgi:hypothetical protein
MTLHKASECRHREPGRNFALRGSTKSMSMLPKAPMKATNRLTADSDLASNYAGYGIKVGAFRGDSGPRGVTVQFHIVA